MSTNSKRPPPPWWKFCLAASLFMCIALGISAVGDHEPWPNDTTLMLVMVTASLIGYLALGFRRIRAQIASSGDGSWPSADEFKQILLGPRLQRWAWIVGTLGAALSMAFYLNAR